MAEESRMTQDQEVIEARVGKSRFFMFVRENGLGKDN
jgi:hypothetical protein